MRHSLASVWLVLLVANLIPAAEPAPDKGDQALLQGTWSVDSIEVGGRPIRNLPDLKYTFQGNVLVRGGKECKVVLDSAREPKHIDVIQADGTRELGTYALEGNALSLWFTDQINVRPGRIDPSARQIRLLRIKKADEK